MIADMSARSAMGEFDSDRRRHLQAFAERLPLEAERLTWPLERLHRLRDERLRALLRTAKARSPWHAKRLAGIDIDAVTGANLAVIPTMTKTDVMEHWDEIVTDRRLTLELAETHLERVASEGPAYLLGEFQVVTTGGSSGRRGVFVWDFEGWLGFGLARERPTFWLRRNGGGDREVRRAFVAAAHSTHPTAILPRTFAGSPQLGDGRSFPATLPLAEIVEPNPGPWTGRRIADIEGRAEGTFVYDGDVEIHLHLFRSALGRRRQMLEYQVRQTPAGADIAVGTSAPLDTDALSRELVEALTGLGVARAQVSVTEVEEIERSGSTGKLRRFIALAPRRD